MESVLIKIQWSPIISIINEIINMTSILGTDDPVIMNALHLIFGNGK